MSESDFAHDRPDNAYRTARLGVARTRYRAPRPAELRRLLDDPAYATAPGVAVRVRVEDGVEAACDAIEERLG